MFHKRFDDLCNDTYDFGLVFGKGWPILKYCTNFQQPPNQTAEILF